MYYQTVINNIFYSLTLTLICQCHASSENNESLLLFVKGIEVQLFSVEDSNNTLIVASNLTHVVSCDYLYEEKLIFWTDAVEYKKGRIQYTNIYDPTRKIVDVVSHGLEQPDGLACDWIGRKIYWLNTRSIEVCELNGTSRKILIKDSLHKPRAIALDPAHAYMYFTDWGEVPKIERAGMDGTRRQILVRDNIHWPNGITIDYETAKVYWVDAYLKYIHRMNLDGTQREEISSGEVRPGYNPALQHPYAITVEGHSMYWTDWKTQSIHSMLKNGSGLPVVVYESAISLDVKVYSQRRKSPGRNPCGQNNGGCSHMCLLSPDPPNYRCACPTGVQIMSDNKTCKNGPDEILLVARRTDLRVISLSTDDYIDVSIPTDGVMKAVAIEFDPVDKYIYWTDDGHKAILKVHLNGLGSESIVVEDLGQSDGMSIDWIARNLYWTDTGRDCITVSRLNGTSRKVLIETEIDEPRAIVLDPVAGHMYWSDWGDNAKIERTNLDGSDRLIFVDTDVNWPNGGLL